MDALELKNTVSEIKISRNRHNRISDTAEEKNDTLGHNWVNNESVHKWIGQVKRSNWPHHISSEELEPVSQTFSILALSMSWNRYLFFVGDCPMDFRIFSSIPGFYIFTIVTNRMSLDTAKCPLREKVAPIEKSLL